MILQNNVDNIMDDKYSQRGRFTENGNEKYTV